jgi:hypothetical protein
MAPLGARVHDIAMTASIKAMARAGVDPGTRSVSVG